MGMITQVREAPADLAMGERRRQQPGKKRSRRADLLDALSFLKAVKDRFASTDPTAGEEFFGLLGRFGRGEIAISDVVAGGKALLRYHPDLIASFNRFIDPRDRIKLTPGS